MNVIKGRIASGSMHPILRINEEVLVCQKASNEIYKRFDIIVFKKQDQLFAHFFWRRQEINGKITILARSIINPTQNDFPLEDKDIVGIIKDKKLTYYYKLYVYFRNIISGSF
jgi:signal peptidase I